jgi:alkylation response protein AidB-like acyl-CoA dehydrogenase
MVKVFASEALDFVSDEGVQIHGGYGYHQDYVVERGYRDARINRIFEGTNEINRLVISGMLLKRAARGQIALFPAVEKVIGEAAEGQSTARGADEESRLVANAKKIGLLTIGLARQKHGHALEKQQEVLMDIADIVTEAFAMESVLLRTRKTKSDGESNAQAMCSVFLRDAMARVDVTARNVLGACSEGDTLRANMERLSQLAHYQPVDAVKLRRRIARRLLERERYVI